MKNINKFLKAINVIENDTFSDIQSKWRKSALKIHPNKGGKVESFQELSSGFDEFKIFFEKHVRNKSTPYKSYKNKLIGTVSGSSKRTTNSKTKPLVLMKTKSKQKSTDIRRKMMARRKFKKQFMAGKIQKAWKGHQRRKKEDLFKKQFMVGKIQTAWRRQKKEKDFKKHFMAGKIQDAWRRYKSFGEPPPDWPTDLRKNNVQDYMYSYAHGGQKYKPIPSSALISNKNRCNNTTANKVDKSKLTTSQSLMYTVAKGMDKSTNRGTLVWHSTGSGKTCTAACIMQAFWDTNRPIIFCTSIEAKVGNPPSTFNGCINTYFGKSRSDEAFTKRVKSFSFAQMAHFLQLYRPSGPKSDAQRRANILTNGVLIIDEVQNLFHPLESQRKEHNALEHFLLHNAEKTKNMKIFVLTATPGDSPSEVVKLLNLVRDRTQSPITGNLSTFGHDVKGLVSYLNTNNDASKFPSMQYKSYTTVMSDKQYAEYADAYQRDLKKKTQSVGKYFSLARRYSSMMLNLKPKMSIDTFSSKLEKFMDVVKQNPTDKHYLYSSFFEARGTQGVLGAAKVLEQFAKYEKVTPAKARELLKTPTKKKRYCLMITTQFANQKQDGKDLIRMYNMDQNRNGEICQIMLASQKFNESIDLKAVKHVHILEPLITDGGKQQTVGRARRNCSHSQYPSQKDWKVTVHEYFSDVSTPQIKEENPNVVNTKTTQNILKLEQNLGNLKGVRGVKNKRVSIQTKIKELKTKLKPTRKNVKKLDVVPPIDSTIKTKSDNASSQIRQMLQLMRDNSFDCRVLSGFHNMGGRTVSCLSNPNYLKFK